MNGMDEQPTEKLGCKYGFGCALFIVFLLAVGGPLLWLLINEDLRGYGF